MNRYIGIVCLFCLLMVAGSLWHVVAVREAMRAEAEGDLRAIAELKVELLEQWRGKWLNHAAALQDDPHVSRWVRQALDDRDPMALQDLTTRFELLCRHYGYDDVLLIDQAGQVLVSFRERTQLSEQILAGLRQALARHSGPSLTDLHLGQAGQALHEGVVIPFSQPDNDAALSGAIVLQMRADAYLYPILAQRPIKTETGESLLVRREGDEVVFFTNLRHRQDEEEQLRLPISRQDLPAVKAALGQQGIVYGVDYRGVEVVACLLPVPFSDWFMVVKEDKAEAMGALRTRSVQIVAMLLVVLLAAAVTAISLVQRRHKQHYRRLYREEVGRRRAEERYAVTLMSIGDGVIVTDEHQQVVLLNPVAEDLTGWSLAEATDQPLSHVFPIINEETRATVESPVERVIREKRVVGLANHTLLIHRDGREIPIADSGAPIEVDGQLAGVVLVFRDQSAERQAARELKMAKQRAEQYLQTAAVMMVALDREGKVTMINAEASRVLGYADDELLGQDWCTTCLPDTCREEVRRILARAMAGEAELPGENENHVLTRDGSQRLVEWHNALMRAEDGAITGTLSSGKDITERQLLESQLQRSQKLEAVGSLAGGVAHDFNNMLTIIRGQADLAMHSLDPDTRVHQRLQDIAEAAERSADLTRQLLAFARKQTVKPVVLDLNETVAGLLKMLQRLIGEHIDLVWKPGSELWPIEADPSQIDQILANLLVNARDAIEGVGKVTIETTNRHCDQTYRPQDPEYQPGDYVVLVVSDDGKGMDRETMGRIFEPFFTTKAAGKGSGLGLATIFGIVKQNGGFINVYSEPGAGTVFRIHLPRTRRQESTAPETLPEPLLSGGAESILLLEDEAAILELATDVLKERGYEVNAFLRPQEALDWLAGSQKQLDLLITDVIMPEMNGRDLAREITSRMPHVKVLYMSGYTANVIVHHGVLDEGIAFIEKPFTPRAFASKVRAVLDGE